jgi:hypothetical protein
LIAEPVLDGAADEGFKYRGHEQILHVSMLIARELLQESKELGHFSGASVVENSLETRYQAIAIDDMRTWLLASPEPFERQVCVQTFGKPIQQ